MSVPVLLTAGARDDLRQNARWWAEHRSVEQAERWYDGFLRHIDSLAENPQRCPLARENHKFPYELRELHYGVGSRPTHRALFTIRPDAIIVLAIRHGAQRDITLEDI